MSSIPAWLHSLHHDGSIKYVSNPYPALGDTVHLRLRMDSNAPLQHLYLRTAPDGEQRFTPMQFEKLETPSRWYVVDLRVDEPDVNYRFLVHANDGVWWYTAGGPTALEPLDSTDFRLLAGYHPVEWVRSSVFYQVFPDRFANGDPTNDPQPEDFEIRGHRPMTYPWGASPDPDQPFSIDFYGGDLQGIAAKLDYLQSLGINALYLNPVFTSYSNHRYDVLDYTQVDPHLGGDAALANLRQLLDQRGMRYLLDIVPNHTGYGHPWFQAARRDPNSTEAGFFTFKRHPEEYASWLGVWSLPKLNYRSLELRRRIYGAPDSIFRRWLQPPFSADGWRVDVANMLGRQGDSQLGVDVIRQIRQAVKETRPDAYLVGENFFDATPQLQGDQWDAVMNYMGLATPLLRWLTGFRRGSWGLHEQITSDIPWSTQALVETLILRLATTPWVISLQQYNLLNSHDTDRLATVVAGNRRLHRLAAIVQFTWPGVPAIYYGDEIGLPNHPQLTQRACMPWDESIWDHELLDFYRALVDLRRSSIVLQEGGLQVLTVEPDAFAYLREYDSDRVIVIAQRDARPRPARPIPVSHAGIPDGACFREHFSGQEVQVNGTMLTVPEHAQGGSVWLHIS